MRYHCDPDVNDLIVRAVEQGWRHEKKKSNHHRLIPPDKQRPIVVFANSASDYRSYHNFRSQLKRCGVNVG